MLTEERYRLDCCLIKRLSVVSLIVFRYYQSHNNIWENSDTVTKCQYYPDDSTNGTVYVEIFGNSTTYSEDFFVSLG